MIVAMNQARQSMLAFHLYAATHGERFPATFEEAASGADGESVGQLTNAATQFEILYHGPLKALTNSAQTIVLRQKDPWLNARGVWTRLYGFADGHVEAHSAPDGDFSSWEAERTVQSQ
jgi:hypothetical protein